MLMAIYIKDRFEEGKDGMLKPRDSQDVPIYKQEGKGVVVSKT